MYRILLIDPKSDYGQRVSRRLNRRLNPYAELTWCNQADLSASAFDLWIIQESCRRETEHAEKSKIPFVRLYENKPSDQLCFARDFTLHQWIDTLIRILASLASTPSETEQSVFLLHAFNDPKRNYFRQNWLNRLRKSGKRLFILPLMPLYDWQYMAEFKPGPDLAGLTLQLETCAEPENYAIGQLFQSQPDGYFLINPGWSADDIFTCEKRTLLLIAKFFSKWIRQAGKNATGLIECKSIPLATIAEIGLLCDVCYFHLPHGESFGDRAARANLAEMLITLHPHVTCVPIPTIHQELRR